MAGHNNRDRIGAIGGADGAHRFGAVDSLRQFAIGNGGAEGNAGQLLPDTDLEVGPAQFDRQIEPVQLDGYFAGELDRFDLSPDRLNVEILETVIALSPDDTITRNIKLLSDLGCQIDLDDFGTGHASLSSIRRFAVQRIKIDRSFVTRVDRDAEQQRMVAAILMMAEKLGLETLAEGVETAGEHATLAQLGCGHVQGFGIALPMPFEQTALWIRSHVSKLQKPPEIGRQTG